MALTDLTSTINTSHASSSKYTDDEADLGTAVEPSVATTARKYHKDLYGTSFLWPLMLLANNIGEILAVINIPGQVAYWIGLGIFLLVGLIGVVGKPLLQCCRKPKDVTKDKKGSKPSRLSRLKKYTFWKVVIRDALSFTSGALYVAGDNLTLLYTPEVLLNPDELAIRSYFRSYLIAGALLVIVLAHGLFLILDPMCGLESDKKTVDKLKTKVKDKFTGVLSETIALSTITTSASVNVTSTDATDGRNGRRDSPEVERTDSPSESSDSDEDSDDTLLDPKYWQVYVQRLTIFLALAALTDQFYGAIVDEITQRNMNVTSGVGCSDINRTAGVVFYFSLSAFSVLGVVAVGLVYACRQRKAICDRACSGKCCGLLELLICIFLTLVSMVYIPVYLTGDNQWPWICFANENNELDLFQSIRQFFLWVSFFITFILLFMEPLFVTWPRRLLSKLYPNENEQEWYKGYLHLNKAIPLIAKDVKEMCSRTKPDTNNTTSDS